MRITRLSPEAKAALLQLAHAKENRQKKEELLNRNEDIKPKEPPKE